MSLEKTLLLLSQPLSSSVLAVYAATKEKP